MDVTDYGDTGLGAMLRVWRDRLSPSAVGLPALGTRRTLGLRREELSELAGISVDYLVRLEQGRAERPSTQVVASLARALHLTGSERNHLYRLARLAPPTDAFRGAVASGAVDAHREERKLIQHPSAGAISVDCDVLADGDTELKIVLLTAAPDTEDDTKLRRAMASDGVCEVRALRRPSISLNSCAGH